MTTRYAHLAGVATLLLLGLQTAGCGPRLRWHIVREPSDATVAAALQESEGTDDLFEGVSDPAVPSIPPPLRLRPCCAFGADLRTQVGAVPIPGMAIANVVGPGDIGPHRYDGGMFAMNPGADPTAGQDWGERNGLVYTCRGGFIDIAHVRDYADWTIFLSAKIFRGLHHGDTITLPDKGGQRRVIVHPVPKERLAAVGARELAIATGQWLAFQLSIWHETATWYGWSWFRAFPETASAFSPEDLYSDLVGTRIAGGIITAQSAETDSLYEATMNVWLRRTLERLGAQPTAVGREAMFAVDGAWWDSSRRLPDKRLTLRRYLDTGPTLVPWLVSDAGIDGKTAALLADRCGDDVRPIALRNPDTYRGIPLREVATLEIDVSAALVRRGFPLPRPDSTRITQEDFPAIVAAVAADNDAQFGAAPAP
ncbi:MAG: DUF4056 domain-containing protein [Candidatus Binatia bacterium]